MTREMMINAMAELYGDENDPVVQEFKTFANRMPQGNEADMVLMTILFAHMGEMEEEEEENF